MANFIQLLAFCVAIYSAGVSSFDPTWSNLRATWGLQIWRPNVFGALPLTIADAKDEGYVPVSDGSSCHNGTFLGFRFMKPNEPAIILIYDVQGYVAGIQTALLKNQIKDVEKAWFAKTAMFNNDTVEGNEAYTLTAYLIQPEQICTTGRTEEEFDQAEAGSGLYFQNGTDPLHQYTTIPMQESAIGSTLWTKGRCFVSMGQHYWYNTSHSMDCKKFAPAFLLYNHGKLTGFGWAAQTMLTTSNRYEHPTKNHFGSFFQEVPECLNESYDVSEGFTTMHIFMNSKPWNLFC